MLERIKSEPALVMGLIQSAVVVAVSFGAKLTAEQSAAIFALVAVLLSIVTRQMVTPNSKVRP
jgi:hypothetical protein